jgi:hypothetical protein
MLYAIHNCCGAKNYDIQSNRLSSSFESACQIRSEPRTRGEMYINLNSNGTDYLHLHVTFTLRSKWICGDKRELEMESSFFSRKKEMESSLKCNRKGRRDEMNSLGAI